MAAFTFTLDSFQILETRSLHLDTDFVTFSVVVNPVGGKGVPQVFTKSMGDLNNGVFPLNASFTVDVAPTDTVVLNYLIANSGHQSPGTIENALESAAKSLLDKGADALAGLLPPIPELKSLLEDLANWVTGEIFGLLNADCDGMVAAEQNSLTYDQLVSMTARGPFRQYTNHPGMDSPHGCGKNSLYIVSWDMLEVGNVANKIVPNVVEMTPVAAQQAIHAAGLTVSFHGPIKQHAWVASQAPVAGTIVDEGSAVGLVLATGSPRVVQQRELVTHAG